MVLLKTTAWFLVSKFSHHYNRVGLALAFSVCTHTYVSWEVFHGWKGITQYWRNIRALKKYSAIGPTNGV